MTAPQAQRELFISVAEAAARINVSIPTAYSLIRQGEIPSRKFGRLIRVPVAGLEALAAVGPQPMEASFS